MKVKLYASWDYWQFEVSVSYCCWSQVPSKVGGAKATYQVPPECFRASAKWKFWEGYSVSAKERDQSWVSELLKGKPEEGAHNWNFGLSRKISWLLALFETSNTESFLLLKAVSFFVLSCTKYWSQIFQAIRKHITSYGKHSLEYIIWWLCKDLIIPTSWFQALFY